MPRAVDYVCEDCGDVLEELFNDTEERPDEYPEPCDKCGAKRKKRDWKANCQRWNYNDRGGL